MKIMISDYAPTLKRNTAYEVEYLKKNIPDADVEVVLYEDSNRIDWLEKLKEVDGLITAFIPVDEVVLDRAEKLRCISVNATGYNTVDLEAARKHDVKVCYVREYCTQDVAEHTMAMLLASARELKHYTADIEQRHLWSYTSSNTVSRLEGSTLAIFGFGKIGQAVAERARAFGMQILAVDPRLPENVAAKFGAVLVDPQEAFAQADYITNHMRQTEENSGYFNYEAFRKMKKKPVFLNMARGEAVVEADLVRALDEELLRGAALDLLCDENPDLDSHPLLGRENVILTPHMAFYSVQSMRNLQTISCDNLIGCLTGRYEKVDTLLK